MQFRKLSIPPPSLDEVDRFTLSLGMIPGYRRVWDDGVDVTDRPVSEWPFLMQQSYANGWRPIIDLQGNFME